MDYSEATAEDFEALQRRLLDRAVDEMEKIDPNIPLIELLQEACAAIDELSFRMHCNEFGSGV